MRKPRLIALALMLGGCSFSVDPIDTSSGPDAAVDLAAGSVDDLTRAPDLTMVAKPDLACSTSCNGLMCGQVNACGTPCCMGSGCTPAACSAPCHVLDACGVLCLGAADNTSCTVDAGNGVCYTSMCLFEHSVFDDTGSGTLQAVSTGYELGMQFTSDQAGVATKIRFYKAAGAGGPHVGHLWSASGTLLATASFATETASGWQETLLPSPVPIAAATTFVVSYSEHGGFAKTANYFDSARDVPPLHVPALGGVYGLGEGSFPSTVSQNANYWVDVVVDLP